MQIKSALKSAYYRYVNRRLESQKQKLTQSYISGGCKPWTPGYSLIKEGLIVQSINDPALLETFSTASNPLNSSYGEFLDERVIEYPWLLSRLSLCANRFLDAGSALNFDYILLHEKIKNKEVIIVTLEPESTCLWKQRIGYLFSDIRDLPLRENYFDEVASISTIEHIGMDNSIYSSNAQWQEKKNFAFLKAVGELKRVTKPGGKVYITVPYGKYTDFGWYQQFNAEMIQALIDEFQPSRKMETYFKYDHGGWNFAAAENCQDCEGFNIHDTKYFNPNSTKDYDPDYAACSRAIAALELWK
ncbi:methylase [filamentous cyanobacterium CCT1]|nr:methylase [filamentous cyanobacterium CCT1]PSN78383.1 methylase [filamentous cyanobacterium CCP4]